MFDFQEYVAVKKNPDSKRNARGFGEYAYSGDVRILNSLSYAKPVRIAAEASVRAFKAWRKSDLLGKSVKVSARQFPHLYGVVRECAEELSIPVPAVYITQDFTGIDANTFGTDRDAFTLIKSATVDHLTDAELRFLIGREFGKVQNSHVTYHTSLYFLSNSAGMFVRWIVAPARLALAGWARRAEITADRAGLLCCRDEAVATAALVKIAVGSTELAKKVDIDDYLKQIDDIKEGIGRVSEYLLTEPYLPKRVKALRLFAESDYYRHHLGERGGTPLIDVDREVDDLISVL
jgi:Zn-dependent protease with chaperone function